MKELKVECTRVRACKWKGLFSELKEVPNVKDSKEFGIEITDRVCPKCGCKTYYER